MHQRFLLCQQSHIKLLLQLQVQLFHNLNHLLFQLLLVIVLIDQLMLQQAHLFLLQPQRYFCH